jgi:hypothetical protein
MADAGAREIRALLSSTDGDLDSDLQALGEALPEDDAETPTPDSAFDAMRRVRRSYQRLARQVRAIKTSSAAKRDVLDALRVLDGGLKLYARGLREPDTDAGRERIADGAGRTKDGASALVDAMKALA